MIVTAKSLDILNTEFTEYLLFIISSSAAVNEKLLHIFTDSFSYNIQDIELEFVDGWIYRENNFRGKYDKGYKITEKRSKRVWGKK